MNLNFTLSHPSPNFTNLRHWWHKVNCWKWTELALVPCVSRIHSLIHTTPNRLLTASLRLGLGLDSLTPQSNSPSPFPFLLATLLTPFIACSRLHHTFCNLYKVKMMHISVFLRQFAFIDFLWFSPYAYIHRHCMATVPALKQLTSCCFTCVLNDVECCYANIF